MRHTDTKLIILLGCLCLLAGEALASCPSNCVSCVNPTSRFTSDCITCKKGYEVRSGRCYSDGSEIRKTMLLIFGLVAGGMFLLFLLIFGSISCCIQSSMKEKRARILANNAQMVAGNYTGVAAGAQPGYMPMQPMVSTNPNPPQFA